MLKELVSKYGASNWNPISEKFNDRTPRQCRDRWNHYLSRDEIYVAWKEEDDDLLMTLYKENGSKWSKIAKLMKDRTPVTVRNRCCLLLRRQKGNEIIEQERPIRKCLTQIHQPRIQLPSCDTLPFPDYVVFRPMISCDIFKII